jgi:hypothetical protein
VPEGERKGVQEVVKTQAPAAPALESPEAETPLEQDTAEHLVSPRIQWVVDAIVLGVVFGVLLSYLRLPLLLSHTTATGGDTAGHIYPAWYLKTHLLPRGLISGWSPGWYAGFPMLHFYFPLVALIQAALAYVVPFTVAFKLGTVLGTFLLPVAVYVAFRLLRFQFPTPVIGAVFALAFLFMRSFSIYGGNIPSSLSGEYSYSLSLALSLVALALVYGVATEDKGHPILAAIALALTGLSHLLPLFTIVATIPLFVVLAIRKHGARAGLLRLAAVFGLGFALTAIWSIPFEARLPYSTNLHWIQLKRWDVLAPHELWLYIVLAASGAVLVMFSLDRRFLVLLIPAVTSLTMFGLLPQQARLFNARFLPYWYLSVFLAAAYFVGMVTSYVMATVASWRRRSLAERWRLPAVVGLVVIGLTTGIMASSIVAAKRTSFIDNWIKWNYEGFESKASWPELRSLFDDVRKLPPGRVMWEPSPDYTRFGTPDILYAIPYFTDHPTMEGIYYESSVTTNYHFLMASELADHPFNPWPRLPYQPFNLDRGIDHMEMFDVHYFVAWSARAKTAASVSPRLQHIEDAGRWSIYSLRSTGQVVVPAYQPVVLRGGDWNTASISWFNDPDVIDVPLARTGPGDWARVSPSPPVVPHVPLPHAGEVLDATTTDDTISFDTDAIGVPHIVRTSFFPNWRVEGAKGPYQTSPSVMMVIPTQRHVTLRYERTWAEWLGLVVTGFAMVLLALMAVPAFRRRIAALWHA